MCVFVLERESDNRRGRAKNFLSEWVGEMKFYVGNEIIFAEI